MLKRLSVALFLDDSIAPEAVQDLEDAVKAAVGYDAELRTDNMKTVRLPFAEEPPAEAVEPGAAGDPSAATPAEPAAAEEGSDEPSAMTRMLLRRGVEVLTALAFIVLLLSSLRSARKGEAAAKAAEKQEVDPELLAQAQVQELLSSDPKRVGEILTQWAREADAAGSPR